MKYETIFLMVRVTVHADHEHVFDTVKELETQSTLSLTDTANINVLETEILVSRIHNPKVNRVKTHKKVFAVSAENKGS
ncbi:hypothetical protein [Pedobacter soli]|uniref:Uncharacterized protein n=1 Tax=Pedobacter soli TaxID=390242 RepID=A0A1G6WKY2_9SPHI|nr:hypothetical protein [Pedobacter soli]SDD66552.1 hypothetical protein SAMN04488024_10752 [Pedobacter soli]